MITKAEKHHQRELMMAEIVELCRSTKEYPDICKRLKVHETTARRLCKYLLDMHWIKQTRTSNIGGGGFHYKLDTVRAEHYYVAPFDGKEKKEVKSELPFNRKLSLMMGYTDFVPPKGRYIAETMPDIPTRKHKNTIGCGTCAHIERLANL